MKIPEPGDIIIQRDGDRWICATSETIREKTGLDPDINYADAPIKAYSVDERYFNVWTGNETCNHAIAEVITPKTVRHQAHQKPRKHSELIKAWADGADIECYDALTDTWEHISDPLWLSDADYRIKTTRELVCHINIDGEIISEGSGNLSLTFNLFGELISAEVIKK